MIFQIALFASIDTSEVIVMINIIKSFACVVLIFFLSSCMHVDNETTISAERSTTEEQVTEATTNAKNLILAEKGEYYELLRTEAFEYVYRLYDVNHEIVDESEIPRHNQMKIVMTSPYIVRIRTSAGTGIAARSTRYYSVTRDVLSRWFHSVYDESDELVVYSEGTKLVIRNIFDKTAYYREIIEFNHPVSDSTVEPFIDVKFINNGDSIEVTYWTGERDDPVGFKEVTEIIKL